MSMQPKQEAPALRAVMVSRDISAFALLIEDMELALGPAWGELNLREGEVFLNQADATSLEFLVVAADEDDRENLSSLEQIITRASRQRLPVLLVAEDLNTNELHRLIQAGAKEFLPYPLPQGLLDGAIERLSAPKPTLVPEAPKEGRGSVLAVQGLAGGTGATSLAVNLAQEIALGGGGSVCLIDLDMQFGSVASHLDLSNREAVLDLLSDIDIIDHDGFMQALQDYGDTLKVLTAPSELVPLDFLDAQGLTRLMGLATAEFDFVIVDMPKTVMGWSEVIYTQSNVIFCPVELDIRSAHAASRFRATIMAEGLPYEHVRFVLNRAPKFTDLTGRARIKRLGEALNTSIELLLPDGGRAVSQTADEGATLAEVQGKNAYRKEIQKLAMSLIEIAKVDTKAA